jgi:FkbM family methyltransferase
MNYSNVDLSPFEKDIEFIYNDNKFYSSNFNLNWFTELGITPKVIIDVGSYDFGDSIKYKIAFPDLEVYSFEADLERYRKTHKFAENCGIKTFNKAVFSESGIIDFYPAKCLIKDAGSFHNPGEHGGQGSMYKITENYKKYFPHIEQTSAVKINSVKISDFYSSENINEITLVHIDAEGSELEIFKGFGEIRPKLIYVEVQENLFENNSSPESVHKLYMYKN